MAASLNEFIDSRMRKGGRLIPARLQAALALLERLRESPTLDLDDHKRRNSSGLNSHETYGNRAHERYQLTALNKNHGRRSCDIGGWGQELLELLKGSGFESAPLAAKEDLLDQTQSTFATLLRNIIDADPIEVRVKGRSAEAVIRDVLKQAEEKGKSGDVAQYLVGAKLMLRLEREIPVVPANKGDRKSRSDAFARTGDFEIEDATIEIALGLPDDKHLIQIAEAHENPDLEVWLLTHHDRVASWTSELPKTEGIDLKRVVVSSVAAFVGQNISEIGKFSAKGKAESIAKLFTLYNERWIVAVGTPGIRIVAK